MSAEPAVLRALRANDLSRLRELLAQDGGAALERAPDGLTVLQHAAYMGHHDGVRILLERGAMQNIHEAAVVGDLEALRRFLDQEPGLLEAPGPDGFTPLHLAAHFAQHDALELLLERGADLTVTSRNAMGNLPLHAAASGASVATLRILLASGADPDARDAAGNTALHVAAAGGAIPCLQALLEGGADPAAQNTAGQRPLDVAQAHERDEASRILAAA